MASLSVANAIGWVVSPIVKNMVSQVQSYISSQYNWNSEVMSELKNLEATLMEIHLAVNMAQRRALVERNQVALLRQIKEAVCYAEDMLDEFDYILLKEKVEHQGMVTHIASSSLSLMKRLVGLDKLRSKLRKVTESVTRLRACAKMFVKVIAVDDTKFFLSVERDLETMERSTGSHLHEDSIFGRKEEVDELVSVLLKQCDASSPNNRGSLLMEVHTVVGIGGMGKTTVAQLIYNDERISEAFDLRMWVSVSRNFDKINLMKEIITHTGGGKNIELANFNFSMLQEQLKWRISGKRFLLVLDDVWYDENFGEHINKERWREVIAPMESAHVGSKILVTTRMELVAKMLDSRSLFFLQGLGQDASWLLFRKCAYKPKHMMVLGDYYPKDIERIGKYIVERLNGLPLAIKVIGGHLNGKYKDAEWDEVLNNSNSTPKDIMTILRLSYEGLPTHLQRCFAYCSLFPKNYHIDPNRLIHMWIAQGFVEIEGSTNKALEDVGRSYFNDLHARSFFQMLTHGNETFYTMHDIMSDLAIHVAEGECLRFECESMEIIPVYTRHLSVSCENVANLVNYDLAMLRSLIVTSKSWYCSKASLNDDVLSKLKSVRVLDISGCCLKRLPDAVNRLIHLRFLGIRRTYYPLPKNMPLYHLQALFVQYHSCYSLRKIGIYSGGKVKTIGGQFDLLESINKLTNLVHVTVEKAYVLMLSSTHNLPSVECAGEFHVDKAEGSLLGLRDFNMLQGQLAIMSLDKIKCREEAYKGHLHLKKHVTKLELQWGSCKCASDTSWGFEVLDALKPHPDLEELTISGYPGTRSPSWLDSGWLSRVQLICLRDCRRWEVLAPLGDLPLLKILEVRRMEELKTLGQELFGCAGFPNLETLLLERLPKLEWCHIDDNGVFCNLRHLSVSACPKLRVYPTYPRTLEHIAIMEKEDIQVKAFLRNSVEISRSFCCLVSSFFHVLHAHHLEFVEDMQIHVNENVVGMSRTVLGNLNSLKSLTIFGINRANTCSVLATLWDENGSTVLPSSLRRLRLMECYLEPSSFSKMLNSLSVLDTLSLEGCETVGNPCPPINIRMLKGLYIRRCYGITSFDVSEAFVPLEDMNI
ncbi:hypothetical protein QOZ80_6AG0545170 [Eleusine coracana subsp. coracana]|nr:hypothetical protein QOZ80_6AG0545170 [Eleusine coracana subsp. coracana]